MLALAINVGLLLVLMTLGVIPPPQAQRTMRGIVLDLFPQQRSSSETKTQLTEVHKPLVEQDKPLPKPPPIILPVKPTITPPPQRSRGRS